MRCLSLWLALTASCADAFGSLLFGNSDKKKEKLVAQACSICQRRLNHTLGFEWMRCVTDELYNRQTAEASLEKYLALSVDEFEKLRPGGRHGSGTDELMNMMRNYSCEADDGGSQPLRSFLWTFTPAHDPCGGGGEGGADGSSDSDPGANRGQAHKFAYLPGFLPAGNDLKAETMTEEEAQLACWEEERCLGVTFQASEAERKAAPGATHRMLFKTSAEGHSRADGWHTLRKLRVVDCSTEARARRGKPQTMTVHVLQESPPVFVVDDFLSDEECDHMLTATIPKMGPSVVGGGGTSNWRRSYSVNMVPDFDFEDDTITRVARRKFAFAREVAGYPVDAVYYQHDGDQYRPHCDGECHGGAYTLGSRVASSLAYCLTAERGGYTLFTRTHLKLVPKRRQMLFFGYFFNGSTAPGVRMDDGWTEHTGCPVHEGKKWIATMWYREGVTPDKGWEYWSHRGREGV
jgi:hypothetical protein